MLCNEPNKLRQRRCRGNTDGSLHHQSSHRTPDMHVQCMLLVHRTHKSALNPQRDEAKSSAILTQTRSAKTDSSPCDIQCNHKSFCLLMQRKAHRAQAAYFRDTGIVRPCRSALCVVAYTEAVVTLLYRPAPCKQRSCVSSVTSFCRQTRSTTLLRFWLVAKIRLTSGH